MRRIRVFFYGSYMNLDVLQEVDLVPEDVEVARLPGYDLTISPHANLHPQPGALVWGLLASATHDELARLYADHAQGELGETYLPEAILAVDAQGRAQAALCYLSPNMVEAPADKAYVERIIRPAKEHGFPPEYVRKIGRLGLPVVRPT